jgi:hypothetical protein
MYAAGATAVMKEEWHLGCCRWATGSLQQPGAGTLSCPYLWSVSAWMELGHLTAGAATCDHVTGVITAAPCQDFQFMCPISTRRCQRRLPQVLRRHADGQPWTPWRRRGGRSRVLHAWWRHGVRPWIRYGRIRGRQMARRTFTIGSSRRAPRHVEPGGALRERVHPVFNSACLANAVEEHALGIDGS